MLDLVESDGSWDSVVFGEEMLLSESSISSGMPNSPSGMQPYLRSWLLTDQSVPFDKLWKEYRFVGGFDSFDVCVQWVPIDYVSPTIVTISWDLDRVKHSGYGSYGSS